METDNLHQRKKRDATSLLYQNGLSGIIITIVSSSSLVFSFAGTLPNSTRWLWWTAMIVILTIRFSDTIYWHIRVAKSKDKGHRYMLRYSLGTIATSILWAIYPLLVFKHLSMIELACTMIVLSAMAGGASSVLAPNKWLALFYIACMLIPTSVLSLLSSKTEIITLGALGFAFCIIMIISCVKASKFIQRAITIHNQNVDLLSAKETEAVIFSKINAELTDAYRQLNASKETLECKVLERTLALEELAKKDTLTGLFNRKAFVSKLTKQWQHNSDKRKGNSDNNSKKVAIFFIDLDGFKAINDLKGHVAGDQVLIAISDRLRTLPGFHGAMCRWGGDEFIVSSQVENEKDALAQCAQISATIARPIHFKYEQAQVGCTIGVALYPDHGHDVDTLIHAADIAMYSRKQNNKGGGNIFSPGLLEKSEQTQRIKRDLRKAVERNEFKLVYQPIVSTNSNHPLCFEALLRWHKPEGMIRPDIFIPIAESSGAIIKIGTWVLKQACMDAASWTYAKDAHVSINVSLRQLMDPEFLLHVQEALRLSGLQSNRLHIEITESLFAEDKGNVTSKLESLREMGAIVSIDDFGTGFSSLSYLQSLPVDQIKIDQTFIRGIQSGGTAIIEATISIARALNYSIVAEGVETKEELIALTQLGVDYIQGYYFSKPMPMEALQGWCNEFTQNKPDEIPAPPLH